MRDAAQRRRLDAGVVSDLGRKNCWTLAERAGHPSPDRLQHLLARAKWDTEGVMAHLRGYVDQHLGDPDAVLLVMKPVM